jgi:hypothetical protein
LSSSQTKRNEIVKISTELMMIWKERLGSGSVCLNENREEEQQSNQLLNNLSPHFSFPFFTTHIWCFDLLFYLDVMVDCVEYMCVWDMEIKGKLYLNVYF